MENNEYPGVNVELYQQIAQRLDFKIEWIRAPFKRCLVLLKQGKADILNAASFKPERMEYGLYPMKNRVIDEARRLKYDSYMAYTPADSTVYWNGESFVNLTDKRVLIEIGASIESKLYELGMKVQTMATMESAFSMLEKNRVSLVVTNISNGYKYGGPKIRELEQPIVTKPYYLMVSRQFNQKRPSLVKQIWYVSGLLQKQQYQRVLNRYKPMNHWPE